MNSLKVFDRRVGIIVIALALLLAIVTPTLAMAAQLTQRSIALTSSSKAATDVSYQVKFTPGSAAAGAIVLDFCSNSPLIGEACTAPVGFDVSAATTPTAGFTVNALEDNTIVLIGTVPATNAFTIDLEGVDNPTNSGPLYARILTFNNDTNAAAYAPEFTTAPAGLIDDGGAAISITDTIGVSGAVLETMTFCVSAATILENCTGVTAPTLKLGEEVDDIVALSAEARSEGNIHTQISTNAVGGAVISLKSSATGCGGLVRAGAPSSCDIAPALQTGISQTGGEAKFGVRTNDATDTGDNPDGQLLPVTGSGYNNTTFALNFNELDESTGVTSTFGDPFLDTRGAPANNKNMALTFGASITNSTPAGLYSTNLSLIATGRF